MSLLLSLRVRDHFAVLAACRLRGNDVEQNRSRLSRLVFEHIFDQSD